ncbi:hypothetical protein HY479_02025 [Candidatus Uhrbacteria bacterium]|nr:hypothetical protein [Candidatus Uhrbacteria bacterium]
MNARFAVGMLLVVTLGGAGCANTQPSNQSRETWKNWTNDKTGLKLVNLATIQRGSSVVFTDGDTGRKFKSVMTPTFTDNNGKYLGQKPGESIEVQLGVGGTIKEDHDLFGKIERLSQFDDGNIGDWSATAAYDAWSKRWVVRAAYPDPGDTSAYSVIECLSVTDSEKDFWDACRTMIERAELSLSTVPAPK